ncbi:GNAT family N-acetyltransferase [Sneathiella sp. HT1-7]|uniref:GNAT family N-acetyltransferase n=1 Tax=Sneathiella sp. HT1-7 TaxID=2887192 RepID=UPI001D14EA69|nr:N-acetyltransferase [Sneathiella sp. HT1-7]MCC3306465.1 N-acetyltransferase [Sneathiella sp. HT1-7]
MPQIIHEQPEHVEQIEPLLDRCFGPDRFKKTAYKVRENTTPLPELSFVTVEGDKLLATIRYWPIMIGNSTSALLLGPIAVEPDLQGKGIGVGLMRETIKVAIELGHHLIVLVGDPEYYSQFGFQNAAVLGFEMPGPVEERRLLVKECAAGALGNVSGMISGVSDTLSLPGRIASKVETDEMIAGLAAFAPPSDA